VCEGGRAGRQEGMLGKAVAWVPAHLPDALLACMATPGQVPAAHCTAAAVSQPYCAPSTALRVLWRANPSPARPRQHPTHPTPTRPAAPCLAQPTTLSHSRPLAPSAGTQLSRMRWVTPSQHPSPGTSPTESSSWRRRSRSGWLRRTARLHRPVRMSRGVLPAAEAKRTVRLVCPGACLASCLVAGQQLPARA